MNSVLCEVSSFECRISRTEFLYRVNLSYGDKSLLSEMHSGGKRNDANLVRLASKHLSKEGEYTASIILEDGYCHSTDTNCTCVLGNASLSFNVVCGAGFRANVNRECMEESFDKLCDHANISIGSKVLSSAHAFGSIGESTDLTVVISRPDLRDMEVVLVPINTVRGPINMQGRFAEALTRTGDFTVIVREKNGSSACSLQSNLRIECKDSHVQVGTQCVLKSAEARLQIVLGISLGIVLALCVLYFLFLVTRSVD